MQKNKLNLNDLEVQSFITSNATNKNISTGAAPGTTIKTKTGTIVFGGGGAPPDTTGNDFPTDILKCTVGPTLYGCQTVLQSCPPNTNSNFGIGKCDGLTLFSGTECINQ